MDSVTDLLQQLVRIPSVNPDGDPGTDRCGEESLAIWLGDFLSEHGFAVTTEEVEPGRPNLLACSPGSGSDSRPRILLGPHLDTVGIGGMTIDPFGGELRSGKLWGRGASDTKGSMAAMIWGLIRNRERLADLAVAVDFVAFMSEESGQQGSRHFVQKHGAVEKVSRAVTKAGALGVVGVIDSVRRLGFEVDHVGCSRIPRLDGDHGTSLECGRFGNSCRFVRCAGRDFRRNNAGQGITGIPLDQS